MCYYLLLLWVNIEARLSTVAGVEGHHCLVCRQFQGRECHAVIFVTCVTRKTGALFVGNTNRLCAAMSALFVIGDIETVNTSHLGNNVTEAANLATELANDGEVVLVSGISSQAHSSSLVFFFSSSLVHEEEEDFYISKGSKITSELVVSIMPVMTGTRHC